MEERARENLLQEAIEKMGKKDVEDYVDAGITISSKYALSFFDGFSK